MQALIGPAVLDLYPRQRFHRSRLCQPRAWRRDVWATPHTWAPGEFVTSALLNQNVRDNESVLKTSIADDGRVSGEIKTFREEITTLSIASNAVTLDLTLSNNFKVTLTANLSTITVSNWTASKAASITFRLTQDGTGGRTVAFPAGWKWSNATAPTMPTAANKTMIVVLYSDDGGTTIFASTFVLNA